MKRAATSQAGYALVMLVFLTTVMLIAVLTVAPNLITQGRREREKEMIWRGNQYIRAIKVYYRKNGRFPTTLDDLTKPKTGIRYMRQAYKDPMNPADGTWRLIYVGPAGQLIGSLKPRQTIQLPTGSPAQVGTPAANLNGPPPGTAPAPGAAPGQAGTQPAPGQPGAAPPADGAVDDSGANPTSMAPTEAPTIIGGSIIGIGSKINHRSVIVYEKATNYRQFEFIWDPSKDVQTIGGQPGQQIGTPAGQPSGQPAPAPAPATPPEPPVNPPGNEPSPPPN